MLLLKISYTANTSIFLFHLQFEFNTLTLEDGYLRQKRKNLPLPIQMQLSKDKKQFTAFIIACLESTLNFEH